MIQRCHNPNNKDYPNWGGRGIEVFKPWRENKKRFWLFVIYIRTFLGPKPSEEHSLDRMDNNQGYIPGNLRWATPTQQIRNSRRKFKN